MTDPNEEITAQLRRVGEHLDRTGGPVRPDAAMDRSAPLRGLEPRHAVAAAVATVAVVLGAGILVAQLDDEGVEPLETVDQPTSTTEATSAEDQDETSYEGPIFNELPKAGFAVVEEQRLALFDHDGDQLATVRSPVTSELGTRPGFNAVVVRPDPHFEFAEGDPAEAPPGCDTAAGAGGVRVALCGGTEQQRSRIMQVAPNGESTLVAEAPPGAGGGHWRWAVPSPDGRWLLAQWSGECEIPSAWLVALQGGRLHSVDGASTLEDAAMSTGVSWASDGTAVVQFHGEGCGQSSERPGVYRVEPEGLQRDMLHEEGERTSRAYAWTKEAYGNERERILARALDELGVAGCCGEPSHGGDAVTGGVIWRGTDIPVIGLPAADPPFVPFIDQLIEAEPIDVLGSPAVAGEADLGPFVSFTCGGDVWAIGGAGIGERATTDAVQELAEALLPHLYCTVGERPDASGHGSP